MHLCKLHWSLSSLRKALIAFFTIYLYDFEHFIDLTKLALLNFLFSICSNFGLQMLFLFIWAFVLPNPLRCRMFCCVRKQTRGLRDSSQPAWKYKLTISTNPASSIQRGRHGVWGVGHWRGMRGVRLCGSRGMANATGGGADFDTWTCCFTAQVSVLLLISCSLFMWLGVFYSYYGTKY